MKNLNGFTMMLMLTSSVLVMSCQKSSNNDNSGVPAPVATTSTPVYTAENATLQCPAEFQTMVSGINNQVMTQQFPYSNQYPNPYPSYQNGVPVQTGTANDLSYNLEENINGQICRTGFQQAYSLQDLCQKLVNSSTNSNCAREQRAQLYVQRCQPCTVISQNNNGIPNSQIYPNFGAQPINPNVPNYQTPQMVNPNVQQPFNNPQIQPGQTVVQPGTQIQSGQQQVQAQRDPNIVDVTCAVSSIDLSGRSRGNFNRIQSLQWNRTQVQSFDLQTGSSTRLGALKLQLAPSDQNNGNTLILQIGTTRAAGTSLTSRVRTEIKDLISERATIADCFLAGQSNYSLISNSGMRGYSCDVGPSKTAAQNFLIKKSRKSVEIASSAEGRITAQFGYVSRSEFVLEEKIGNKLSVKFVVPAGQPLVLGLGQSDILTQSSFGAVCSPSDNVR